MIIHNKISPCETSIYIELIFHLSGNSRCSNIEEGYFKHFYNMLRFYMEHLTFFAGSQDKDSLLKCQSMWTFLATFLLKKIGWKTNHICTNIYMKTTNVKWSSLPIYRILKIAPAGSQPDQLLISFNDVWEIGSPWSTSHCTHYSKKSFL